MDSQKTIELLKKKMLREKNIRKAAEVLLEKKSLELYNAKLLVENSLEVVKEQAEKDIQLLDFKNHLETILLNYNTRLLLESPSDQIFQGLLDDILTIDNIEAIRFCSNLKLLNSDCLHVGENSLLVDLPDTKEKFQWSEDITQLTVYLYQASELSGTLQFRFTNAPTETWHSTIEIQFCLCAEMISAAFQRQLLLDKTIKEKLRAENSEKATKDFVAMINHELRTPLNGLLGAAELIEATEITAYQGKLLTTIHQAGEMLRVIINDLLDISKMNAGMLDLKLVSFSPKVLVETIENIFTSRIKEKGLHFHCELDANVPANLIGDDDRVKQILVNLIGNSAKFTSEGAIRFSTTWHKDRLCFTISDNGCGIPEDKQRTLFDPFTQVDNSSQRKYEGTGLGLSICKMLVEAMQGEISFTSELHKGTQFVISLPLQVTDQQKDAIEDIDAIACPIDSLKILAVEDIKMNQTILGMMLKRLAIEHQFSDDGQQALDYLQDNEVDIILMDCRMPVLDGFQTTQQLRDQGYTKPIVALTAGTTSMEVDACMQCGMDDILHKPYKEIELKATLEKWAQRLLAAGRNSEE